MIIGPCIIQPIVGDGERGGELCGIKEMVGVPFVCIGTKAGGAVAGSVLDKSSAKNPWVSGFDSISLEVQPMYE